MDNEVLAYGKKPLWGVIGHLVKKKGYIAVNKCVVYEQWIFFLLFCYY